MLTSLLDEIDQLPYKADNVDAWLEMVAKIHRTDDLDRLLDVYNWDDGFVVPRAVAQHPACDLGIALKLMWLSDAERFFALAQPVEQQNSPWLDFCRYVSSRILDSCYPEGPTSFTSPLNGIGRKKLEKLAVPAIFISDVAGRSTS